MQRNQNMPSKKASINSVTLRVTTDSAVPAVSPQRSWTHRECGKYCACVSTCAKAVLVCLCVHPLSVWRMGWGQSFAWKRGSLVSTLASSHSLSVMELPLLALEFDAVGPHSGLWSPIHLT